MKFYEKLDFLMKLTSTTNSSLAFHTSLDPSHISRLRRGERSVSKHESYLENMAVYFARNCNEPYQLQVLRDMLEIKPDSFAEPNLSKQIFHWLTSNKISDADTVGRFLDKLSINRPTKMPETKPLEHTGSSVSKTLVSVFNGISGKQDAALEFLSSVISAGEPRTLLLFSDESMEWFSTPSFIAKWTHLMAQAISRGNRIKIIHTVSRNLDEMLAAITQWMPLYVSGAIEPYFYPKKRDGIYRRTLFIAPELSAVVSSSVGDMVQNTATLLFTDEPSVSAYTEEFQQYLSLCKPLMRIFTSRNREAYLDNILSFDMEPTDSIIKSESLSILTMSEELIDKLGSRMHTEKEKSVTDNHKKRIEIFTENLKNNQFSEIISLPDISAVKTGQVKLATSFPLNGSVAYYTEDEYLLHLENLITLLETYENYHLHFLDNESEDPYIVYVKEDLGAFVAKTSPQPVLLAMNESNLTASFWDYLINLIGKRNFMFPSNEYSIKRLREYITRLNS